MFRSKLAPDRGPFRGRPAAFSRALIAMRPALALLLTMLAGCQLVEPQAVVDAPQDEIEPAPEPAAPAAPPVPQLTIVEGPGISLKLPKEETDLVARLRNELSLPSSDDPAVQKELVWFVAHQDYLERVFKRAERYLPHIVGELERRGMPVDLALLPIVESAYDPFAYSYGRAAGLWQIIPGTGRRLGLKQDWWFDGRRDVIESTRAALDYLQQLHEQFDGDWLLAIAGYNSGEGNIVRALKHAHAADRPATFWGAKRYLPLETRTYVPRLLALRKLVADPQAYDVTLPALPNKPYFSVVDTGGQIDMALAAELAGVGTDELYALNPGVNRWATDPEGPYRLLVPRGQAGRLSTALAELGERQRVEWSRHRVKSGETLIQLAQHYHTTPDVLRETNRLHGNLIRAGEYLMIPHAVKSLAAYSQTADARAARKQSRPHAGQRQAHVVKAGESLWSIARRYGVGVKQLAGWNAMAPGDLLSVGRELVVWTDHTVSAQAPSASNERIRRVTYTVRRGDSLYSIAQRFRIRVRELLQWNSISASRYLQPGQRLIMYVDVTKQST